MSARPCPRCARPQAGLTLVEMMVAISLGLVLLASIAQVFLANSESARFGSALARLQEGGRFALDEMATDLRMAGFLGCRAPGASENVMVTGASAGFAPLLGLQGWEADGTAPGSAPPLDAAAVPATVDDQAWQGSPGGPALEAISALRGSDLLRTWHAVAESAAIDSVAGSEVRVGGGTPVAAGDLVTLSDCQHLDLARVCAATALAEGAGVELGLAGGGACPAGGARNLDDAVPTVVAGGSIQRLGGNVYYIGKAGDDVDAPPALFRRRLTGDGAPGPAEELVQGVENMQLLYGVDNDGDRRLDEYRTADAVVDWTTVLAVRIELLLACTETGLVAEGQRLRFNGDDEVRPPDTRLRQSMTSTVTLRNRTF